MLDVAQLQGCLSSYIGKAVSIKINDSIKLEGPVFQGVDIITKGALLNPPSSRWNEEKRKNMAVRCIALFFEEDNRLVFVAQDFDYFTLLDGEHFVSQRFHVVMSLYEEDTE